MASLQTVVRKLSPRFSLRALLIAVTCVGLLCWWHDRPRRVAKRFHDAVAAGQYEAADQMISIPGHRVLARFVQTGRNTIESEGLTQTPSQWLRGECGVYLKMSDSQRPFLAMRAVADARGISRLNVSVLDSAGKETPMRDSGPDGVSKAEP